jgi:hypothetical protein
MNSIGIKYKSSFIYVLKNENECSFMYNKRMNFIVKNIHIDIYENIVLLSNFYINIYYKQMRYSDDIHMKFNEYVLP